MYSHRGCAVSHVDWRVGGRGGREVGGGRERGREGGREEEEGGREGGREGEREGGREGGGRERECEHEPALQRVVFIALRSAALHDMVATCQTNSTLLDSSFPS